MTVVSTATSVPMADENHARRAALQPLAGRKDQRVFDGVVASYIRDISVRSAPKASAASPAGCSG